MRLHLLQERAKIPNRMYDDARAPAALSRRLVSDLLPARRARFPLLHVIAHDAVRTLDWQDLHRAELDGLLHDKIHLFPLQQARRERDMHGRLRVCIEAFDEAQVHGIRRKADDLHARDAPFIIDDDKLLPAPRAHDVHEMVRVRPFDHDPICENAAVKKASHAPPSTSPVRRMTIAAQPASSMIRSIKKPRASAAFVTSATRVSMMPEASSAPPGARCASSASKRRTTRSATRFAQMRSASPSNAASKSDTPVLTMPSTPFHEAFLAAIRAALRSQSIARALRPRRALPPRWRARLSQSRHRRRACRRARALPSRECTLPSSECVPVPNADPGSSRTTMSSGLASYVSRAGPE